METYEIAAECANCGWSGLLKIPKGTPLVGWGHDNKCPRCGCETLRRRKVSHLSTDSSM